VSEQEKVEPTEPTDHSRRNFLAAVARYTGAASAGAAVFGLGGRMAGGVEVKPAAFDPKKALPSQLLDLSKWKISIPIGAGTTQITQPGLATLSSADFKAVYAIAFTVPVGGTVQPGAAYPRSELREMNANGVEASWPTTSGTHTMELTQRVMHLPRVKPQLVAGQIHDANEYVILIRLDSQTLYVEYGDRSIGVLDPAYAIGATFTVKVVASDGFIDVFYNGVRKAHQADRRAGCYFKAGCYLQTNPSKGDAASDYGQVEILALAITHS
jgi:hypothetical protein